MKHFLAGLPVLPCALALFPLGAPQAQSYVLSGRELAHGRRYVQTFCATPDGRRVVYALGRTSPLEHAGLFSASTAASGTAVELGRGTPSFVSAFQLAADGGRVVYRADESVPDLFELYSVPADGRAAPVVLSQDGCAGDVHAFQITPDGLWVLYLRDLTDGDGRLFGVPIDGSAPPQLLSDGAQRVSDFVLSPDGSRVVYRTASVDADALFSVPTDRSIAPITLDDPQPVRGVLGYRVSPDGTRVVYTGLQAGVRRLFVVPIDRSQAPAALDGPGGRVAGNFELTPDGRAVYLADESSADVFELYLVPLDGSRAPVRISGALTPGGDVERANRLTLDAAGHGFRIAPGGTRVVYLADQDTDEVLELYGVPLDGSRASRRLNDPLAPGRGVASGFELSRDGARAVFLADRDADDVAELYSAPLDGSASPVELNAPLEGFTRRDVVDFLLTPDGRNVLYRSNEDVVLSFDLRVVPLDGSRAPRALSARAQLGGYQVSTYRSSPRGDLAFYLGDDDHDGIVELYASPLRHVRER